VVTTSKAMETGFNLSVMRLDATVAVKVLPFKDNQPFAAGLGP
jgi:hypothetical protein